MNRKPFEKWVETFGILAVIASLLFVGFQIRQDHIIARSVLGSESFSKISEAFQTMADPNFSFIYAKMLKNPESLTNSEMLSLNTFYLQLTASFSRACYLVERGVFSGCEEEIRDMGPLFFSNKYAQNWWKIIGPSVDASSLPKWIDSYIANLDTNVELENLHKLRKSLK